MGLEILGKLRDAASMFWASLDSSERTIVLYLAGYLACNVLLLYRSSTRRLELELVREQVLADLRSSATTPSEAVRGPYGSV